jgi:C-terminal processing protease CtpA/Prc
MQLSVRFHLCVLLVLLSLGAAAPGLRADATPLVHDSATPALTPATNERLMSFGRLWAFLKYHHPRLGYGDLDWDAAFVETVPQVLAAHDRDTYAAAVAALLARLEDPVTRVDYPPAATPAVPPLPAPASDFALLEADGILTIRFGTAPIPELMDSIDQAWEKIQAARRIILDLRALPNPWAGEELFRALQLDVGLVKTPTAGPAERWRQHRGYASPIGAGGYYSAFVTSDGPVFRTSSQSADARCVFITRRAIPDVALALQAQGRAAIIVEGTFEETPFVRTTPWPLPEKLRATVRLTERVYPDGRAGIVPDVLVPPALVAALGDEADRLARAWLRGETLPPSAPRLLRPAVGAVPPDLPYAANLYPDRPYRLLGAFRAWAAFEYFFAYKDLIGADWTHLVQKALPEIDAAPDAEAYHLAIARLLAQTGDSHVWLYSEVLHNRQGSHLPPALLTLVEDVPVVTQVAPRAGAVAAEEHALTVGDEIVTIDGRPWREHFDKLASITPASTPQSHAERLANRLLLGPENSSLTLGVRSADGILRQLTLRRTATLRELPYERGGPVFHRIRPDIGYVDLGRLEASQVDPMFDELKDTRAIIFDMRGYPRGSGPALAGKLATRDNIPAALFDFPVVVPPLDGQGDWVHQQQLVQTIRRSSKPRYEGKTVLLINEQAISQAEHLGLWLRAANGTTFIGSPTQGANGTITELVLPGDISAYFTGQRVRWPDGRQLQRVGLQPDVPVRPTLAGIRAGRDEVLEKALEYLEAPPSP